jgi:quercetin dioxygenase-like cupin family protein
MSAFGELRAIRAQRVWDGIVGRSVHGDRITLGVIELDPGSVIPEHRHQQEQLGVLLEGSMTFRVGDETRELGPGATWRIASDVPHEVRVGPEGAVAIDVFAPVREDWLPLPPVDRSPRWP